MNEFRLLFRQWVATFQKDAYEDNEVCLCKQASEGKYFPLKIAARDETNFRHYLKIHQQGATNYPTFCQDAAKTGGYKWTVDFEKMTCTYFNNSGNEILIEKILSI